MNQTLSVRPLIHVSLVLCNSFFKQDIICCLILYRSNQLLNTKELLWMVADVCLEQQRKSTMWNKTCQDYSEDPTSCYLFTDISALFQLLLNTDISVIYWYVLSIVAVREVSILRSNVRGPSRVGAVQLTGTLPRPWQASHDTPRCDAYKDNSFILINPIVIWMFVDHSHI